MDRRAFLTTFCAGTAALSGCLSTFSSGRADTPLPEVPEGSWTQHGADAANTFASDVSAPSRGNLAWTSEAFTQWEPVIADGTVYTTNFAPSKEGSAIALDAQDGSEQWRTTLGGKDSNGRVLVGGRFIVAHDSRLVALDPQNGDIVWQRSLAGLEPSGLGSSAELLAADERSGTVIVPYSDGLKAFQAEDGQRRWETGEITGQLNTPAIYDGTVYTIGRVDGVDSLVALALDDGTIRWTTALEDPSDGDPVATDQGVLVVDGNTLVVHDRETGDRRSEIELVSDELGSLTTIAADGGTTFVATYERGLFAVDIETGTTQWQYDDSAHDDSAFGVCVGIETVISIVDKPESVTSAYGKTVTAFDRETGDVRWNYALDGYHALTIRPILADGAVFFATDSIGALAVLGDVPAE
ncbi:pyrrolo-quinoline quinone [Halogeometricum borinquense]|uniref:Pyrrolo-quinoline quinone n=1 Tax=Halogeometricum borinquense TaxID=60847 RepID=A0A482T991_9EURY|nr:PQQ-binding-like beta-propeller repeat protein [Halogeometricum borinquense]RYJ14290.1 pyrrolo-quinoline quinone [Halogeometricum borinquense]